MASRPVTIVNKLGLHARAAARFVAVASEFDSDIRVRRGGHEVNGKSIMGLMMLAAGRGTELELIAEGDDAEAALDRLAELVAGGFEEGD